MSLVNNNKYILTSQGELYHYGVPGMKWGKRKAAYAAEKGAYKQARKDYKVARKNYRKSVFGFRGMGIEGIRKATAAEKKANSAELNMIDAKAKYKAAKSKNSAKAEFNTYRKEMQKSGLAGSALDTQSGGRSTQLYNRLKATKGKAYADKVQKKVQNKAVGALVGTAAVGVGLAVTAAILENK